MDKVQIDAWNYWVEEQARDMQEYIQSSWPMKGCAQFILGKIHCSWSRNRRSSRGGLYKIDGIWQPGINISMHGYIPRYGVIRHYEYKSFDKNKFIGGFYTDNMELPLLAVVAHEVAHAIQRWIEYYARLNASKPHGKEFKDYYAQLRAVYVNPLLPNQEKMKETYEELNAVITREIKTQSVEQVLIQ